MMTLLGQQDSDAVGVVGLIIYLVIIVLVIAGMWKVFAKAGQPGWACIVPIYNLYVLTQIAGRPVWFIILLFVPIVNFFALALLSIDIAKSFGKSALFGVGLWLLSPIFYAILGFGDAEYQGPAAA